MKLAINPSEALVLREALMSYRNNRFSSEWREPSDGHRIECADDLLLRLDAHGRYALADLDAKAHVPSKPSGAPIEAPVDPETLELMASFWVYYRCEMVGCRIVEPHEHGGGQPMREMTPDELAERRTAAEGKKA